MNEIDTQNLLSTILIKKKINLHFLCFLFQTFILQLEGKTKWKLFKPLQELPQEASPDLELSDLGEPTDEFDMEVHMAKKFLLFVTVLSMLKWSSSSY